MPRTYISLDLETTGLDPNRDAIIEIGALRFDGDQELESFSTFVNPGRSIPLFVTELTGITNADVDGAPSLRRSLRQLSDFVGRSVVIGHNIGFDLAFLRQHSALVGSPSIDTFELAGMLVPHASRYSLANLVQELGLDLPEQTHRALDDARMAHALYMALSERARQLQPQLLKEIIRLGERINWRPVDFFRDAQYLRYRQGFSGGIGAQLAAKRGVDASGPLFIEDEDVLEPLEPRSEPRPIDVEALASLLENDGPIAEVFPEYEYRPQQLEMLEAVAEAFNSGHHLMVEAGTGTGKSLAYLLPAIEWAVQNRHHVVISTNTINLQEQLANKDVPSLKDALYDFRAHVLKGRSHYLCRRALEALRRRGPRTEVELRVLVKVLLWLPNTLDGDGDGLFLPTYEEKDIWQTLSAANDACDPENCRFHQGGHCFFSLARAKAESAHLLIVNHALLLADMASQNRVLPEYNLLIVDEAHHLERATTDAMHYSVNGPTLRGMLIELLRSNGAFPGILAEIQNRSQSLPHKARVVLDTAVIKMQEVGEHVQHQLENLFDSVDMFLYENSSSNNKYGVRLRITEKVRDQSSWNELQGLWSQITSPMAVLVDGLAKLADGLDELSSVEAPELEGSRVRLLGVTRQLAEAHGQLTRFIAEPTENEIYWFEKRGQYPVSFNAVPLQVGEMLQKQLFEKKRSIILTSATLRIAGSFDYLRDRLGVIGASELAVGSPFDYPSVALLYLPNDIPEPRNPGYQRSVEEALVSLFKATEGRALALFTSYSQLRTTAQAITAPLAQEGITTYVQGGGSSRAQLLDNFRRGEKAVLLGTRSFWEGVDVSGDALSCLVIVKLPFDVPSDPIVSARSEAYEDPFNEYMVPEAVLRFMQGFGRLIRTAADQGIAVVLDQRLLTKRYGRRFLDSLPDPLMRFGSRRDLPAIAVRWLAGKSLPATDSEFGADESWSVPPPEEPPWFWGA